MRIAVISDTHSPRYWKRCPPGVARHLDAVDLILHAGDVCLRETLEELEQFAPVHAVRGNNDGPEVAAWGAPETLELELEGLRVAMVHDAGPKQGRVARLHRRFPDAGLVVFGHSHIPLDESQTFPDGRSLRIVNPGSPTDKRRQPSRTLGLLDLADGVVTSSEVVDIP